MQVTLISHTPDALNLLLRTKNTRLTNQGDDPATWSDEKRTDHLRYMLGTIKSSFEFVDYVFQIEGVTRVMTHQLVRHRHGSYAQQAQRVVDARGFTIQRPKTVDQLHMAEVWDQADIVVRTAYGELVDAGVPAQDARGIMPNNIETSILAKFNLRSLHEMMKLRLCTRTQGEMQDVMRAARDEVLRVHSWAEPFLQVQCVADGTCAFENYGPKDCPVWFPELDHKDVKGKAAQRFWAIRHESTPAAKDGKAQ